MPDDPPLSVKDLLPAIIELASIQADLLAAMENPSPQFHPPPLPSPRVERSGVGGFYDTPTSVAPAAIYTAHLRKRSRELLAWLLSAVKKMDKS